MNNLVIQLRNQQKLIQFTDTLISKLDEAIAKVAIALNQDLDDVQLKEDEFNIENTEDIQDINEMDDVEDRNPEAKKGPEPIEMTRTPCYIPLWN